MKAKWLVPTLLSAFVLLSGAHFATAQTDSSIRTLSPWFFFSDSIVTLRSNTAGIRVPSLINCNTIDTDADGDFVCGTDGGGGGGGNDVNWSYFGGGGYRTATTGAQVLIGDDSSTSTTKKLEVHGGGFIDFASSTSASLSNLLNVNGTGTSSFAGHQTTTGLGRFGSLDVLGSVQFLAGSIDIGSLSASAITAGNGTCTTGSGSTVLGGSFTINVNVNCVDAATLDGLDSTAFEQGLTAGDHLTRTGNDFDVDDDFLLNTGDAGTGSYTLPVASTTSFSVANLLNANGTGTSTFAGGATLNRLTTTNSVVVGNLLSVLGSGTSTFAGAFTSSQATISRLTVSDLVSCNTIDTDAQGRLKCGTDDGGAGGSPGGSAKSIQYHDGAIFAGDTDFIWDTSANRMGIATDTPQATLAVHGDALIGTGSGTSTINSSLDVKDKLNVRNFNQCGGIGIPCIRELESDVSTAADTTPVEAPNLAWNSGANQTWFLEAVLTANVLAASDIKLHVESTGATCDLQVRGIGPSPLGGTPDNDCNIDVAMLTATNGDYLIIISGEIVTGANATTTAVAFSQNTSGAGATTLQGGSYLKATRTK